MERSSNTSAPVRCRPIADTDVAAITELLTRGFSPRRSRGFWSRALDRLGRHATPPGLPQYGYMMESGGVPVGVILLISTTLHSGGENIIRCNVSSWYVTPAFRCYAPMLVSRALRHRDVTYLNITPAANTVPMLAAQGYSRYGDGQFVAVPLLSSRRGAVPVRVVPFGIEPPLPVDPVERDILRQHADYGCISLWCMTDETVRPFVFLPRRVALVPCAQLVYCRAIEDVGPCARAIGWFLARRGLPLIVMDANGAVPGMVGRYFAGTLPRYFRGPNPPRLGDLAYTETAIFGV
jgi:hypothetical protein